MKDDLTILPETIRIIANITRFMSLVIAENNRQTTDTSRLSTYYQDILAYGLRFYLLNIHGLLGDNEDQKPPPLTFHPFESDSAFIQFINQKPHVDHMQAMASFYETANTYLHLANQTVNKDIQPLPETAHLFEKINHLDGQIIVGENTDAIKKGLKYIAGTAICIAAACLLFTCPIEVTVAAIVLTLIAGCTHQLMPDSPEVCAEKIITAAQDGTGKPFRISRYDSSAYPPAPDPTPTLDYASYIFVPFRMF